MKKLSAKVKRPLWVAGLNISLVIAIGTSQAFAATPIENQTDLVAIGDSLDGDYVLTKSFDVTDAGGTAYVVGNFTGTFDGGGNIISGLTKPLFSVIESTGVISNLSLEADPTFGVSGRGILANDSYGTINSVNTIGNVLSSFNSVGGLVGYSAGSISDSSATGDVTGPSNVGGLVGASHGSISGSSSFGNVNGDVAVGGLVGDSNGSISNSSASGDVTGNFYVGGLVGNSTSSIMGSYAEGDVISTNIFTGGLVGYSTGNISNSYTVGSVTGNNDVGGLVGYQYGGGVSNSYAAGSVTGNDEIGGLVGYQVNSSISNSYASGDVNGNSYVGGLVGTNYSASPVIDNSYAAGAVNGYRFIGGLVGDNCALLTHSYSLGVVTSTGGDYIGNFLGGSNTEITDDSGHLEVPFTKNEILNILNRGSDGGPIFALNPAINNGLPYLISNAPPSAAIKSSERLGISFLTTQTLESLNKSFGFELEKSDLSKLDLAFLDQVKGDKSSQILGAKLFSNQSLTAYLSIGSLLQLEINFEVNKSLQVWVKGSDGQYVLVGGITFDKDGNAVLPGIAFKKSGQYELIFVNPDKKDLAQPELVNKVSGLTIYVN
jgi:hypothetical protein